ncbi:MAG TPA: hypothetical protein VF791_09625 [Pyrinomonadaceae bacterium]
MSAASPAIRIGEESVRPHVSASLRQLNFQRQLFRSIAGVTVSLTAALAALLLIAFLDSARPLPRVARAILLAATLLTALIFMVRAVWPLLRRRTLVEMAREIERATGSDQNALVTLAESFVVAPEAESYMLARLERQACVLLAGIDERRVAPRRGAVRGAIVLSFVLLLALALHFISPAGFAREARRVVWLASDDVSLAQAAIGVAPNQSALNMPISVEGMRVRVVPPAYSDLSAEEVSGDAPVRALAGSQIEVILNTAGPVVGAALSFNGSSNSMRAVGAGQFSGTFTANVSGAFETRLVGGEGDGPAPLVRAVEVYTDAVPEAHITEPLSDQLLRALPDRAVRVSWTAKDDLGLAGLKLKYIKSRGEGDAAKFTNGELSVGMVERASAREWRGATSLDLRRLDMQPGDTLVFWIEASDRNPNANNLGRSGSLAIALAAPELAKLNLSDLMPNEIGRFLLSQRQIIIKTEKLHKERTRLSPAELKRRANDIAADQREFKNSFNEYLNLEEAEQEEMNTEGAQPTIEEQVRAAEDERTAPHFHGIPEPPPGSSTSVKELTYAIRAMWDAEDALTNAETALALKHEREALARLKHAQAAVRYIPPILPQSKPIDLKRRYVGELAEIETRLEKLSRRQASAESAPVRAALADAYAALNDLQETLGAAQNSRARAIERAAQRAKASADRLISVQSGNHAATIAEAAGQLRVVEIELARLDSGGNADQFAARLSKPLALLTQAASNLFAIAESRTQAASGDTKSLLPDDAARAAEYFRRLAGGR